MKRLQEKIKDLVEARSYDVVKNYTADLEMTVAAYHFTDATADLLAKWLDQIAALSYGAGGGAAFALAGNRGAGKSHLLAVLAAITEQPELRARISDSHVASSAQVLSRRPARVLRVERGLGATLIDELRDALTLAFRQDASAFGATPAQLLVAAVERAEGAPLVVTIDSALARASRIKRDDGALLAEMAEAARITKMFLVVALDDDISGADGVNSAIARTFTINFLDQEHLYRILDSSVFPKKLPARALLRELYQSFRLGVPGFNWSEPRFTALYPVHPVVADVTPAVRHYAPQFAFLPFAAESGSRVLNRPAHSLIALDEMFDRAEPDLRKSEELIEVFAVYNDLANNAVSHIPIIQRLQAKLVLKGLFILSLDGRGATAGEIAAAMLIYDENQPETAVFRVGEMLEIFAKCSNGAIFRRSEGGEFRYGLSIKASVTFETKLAELFQTVENSELERILRGAGSGRFADWNYENGEIVNEIQMRWRGTFRRGRVWWKNEESAINKAAENLDWEIVISGEPFTQSDGRDELTRIYWQTAALRPEEEQTLRRFAVLQVNSEVDEEFGETAVVARQTSASLVERIWTRVFIDEGALWFNGEKFTFSPEAKTAATLDVLLESVLAPVFERKFPAHPVFSEMLGMNEAAQIANELFGASEPSSQNAQKLAQTFAAPLEIVAKRGDSFVLETDERMLQNPLVQKIWKFVENAHGEIVPLREVYALLKAAPYGLSREAQHLILSALVARRRLEFITATGERVGKRALGFKIIWTDLVGVARSSVLPRSTAELLHWARLLTDSNVSVSLDTEENVDTLRAALRSWLENWQKEQISRKFDELPDSVLNVRAWRLATHASRSFGAAAEAVEAILENQISLEEGLERIPEAFKDSTEEVETSRRELADLNTFVAAAAAREKIWRYVALAETTDDEAVENARREILPLLFAPESVFNAESKERLDELWREFRERYAAVYVAAHDSVIQSSQRQQKIEKLVNSAEWIEFEAMSQLSIFSSKYWEQAEKLYERAQHLRCSFDVRELLREKPRCACGFHLSKAATFEKLPLEMLKSMNEGRKTFRKILTQLGSSLARALETLSQKEKSGEIAARAANLSQSLLRGEELPILMPADALVLEKAMDTLAANVLQLRPPRILGANTREELREKLNLWLDNLPDAPFSIKLADTEN